MFVRRAQDAQLPIVAAEPHPVSDIIQKIALKCFKEFSVATASGLLISCFVGLPSGMTLLITATLAQFAVSLFFHSVGAFASYKAIERGRNQSYYEWTVSACEWITGSNFAIFTGYNAQTLVHETGHALASLLIYKRPRPLIEIYPFIGGITQFYKTSLSDFGKKIGPAAATCLVVASGPGLTLLVSAVLLAIGIALKEKYPQLSKYLICWSILDFVNHAFYAYTTLQAEPWNLSHDFVHLSIFGLHPVTATVGLIAIPIVIALGTLYWKSNSRPEELRAAYET
jgi:hypothetical protein